MKFLNNKWFTLIEFMIVISILGIMMTITYAPYNLFIKKADLRNASKNISKTLSESRNMAIHWISSSVWNLSIWVYFDEDNKNIVKIFSYPYNYQTWSQIVVDDDSLILKEIDLWQDIWIEEIEGKSKVLFLFEAISWKWHYFDFENVKSDLVVSDNKIEIEYSYKWASSNLRKTLDYYIKTYISDY